MPETQPLFTKPCERCGEPMPVILNKNGRPKGRTRQFCDKCRRERATQTMDEIRTEEAERFDSHVDCTKTEAFRLLRERGVGKTNAHIVHVVYEGLREWATEHQMPANRFLFKYGVQATLRAWSLWLKQELERRNPPSHKIHGDDMEPTAIEVEDVAENATGDYE
jgi:hypothetical protein